MSSEKNDGSKKLVICSFCGKNQHEVKKIIAGSSVYICNECVDLCTDIIKEELKSNITSVANESKLPTPKEIVAILEREAYSVDYQKAAKAFVDKAREEAGVLDKTLDVKFNTKVKSVHITIS